MSKKSPNKQEKCLICQKPIKLTQTFISIYDVLFDDFVDIPVEKYVSVNCNCLSVYNKEAELIGLNKSFVEQHGEA